jgi:hypothetical protein
MFYPLSHSNREHSALRPGGRSYEAAAGQVPCTSTSNSAA